MPQYKLRQKNPDPNRKIGLGADLSNLGVCYSLVEDALNQPATTIPVIEHTTIDYAGVLTDAEASAAFPPEWKFFNQDLNPGADAQPTTFEHPGILQSAIIVRGVGFHVFAEPLCFTADGNALSPIPAVGQASPMSPDVYSNLATNAILGLSSNPAQTLNPATMSWGWPMQYAAWNLVEAYRFEWVVRNRYDLLMESARYIAHFTSFSDKIGAGTSQVPVMPFAQRINARYRQKQGNSIFLPVNMKRQGLFVGEEVEQDVFRPTGDYRLSDVTWGGLALQEAYRNQPLRMLPVPYCIPSGNPIGLKLTVEDEVRQKELIKWMSAGEQLGGIAPPILTPDQNITAANTLGGGELTLDTTPVIQVDTTNPTIENFKGGALMIAMLINGFELTDDAMQAICSDAKLKAQLASGHGLQLAT